MGDFQGVQQCNQGTDQRRIQASDLVIGLNALISLRTADGIPQQHATQAEMPAVLLKLGRQAQAGTVFGAHPPANAGAFDPAVQCRQVGLIDAKPFA
ncbi:hypothetical protein D3C84_851940 [compost metagenome]